MSEKIYTAKYEVTVTKESVTDMIHNVIFELYERYGRQFKDRLVGIAIGPNAYHCLLEWGRENCKYSCSHTRNGITVQGVQIFAGPLPFPVPIFDNDGRILAHEEAKRVGELLGAYDA